MNGGERGRARSRRPRGRGSSPAGAPRAGHRPGPRPRLLTRSRVGGAPGASDGLRVSALRQRDARVVDREHGCGIVGRGRDHSIAASVSPSSRARIAIDRRGRRVCLARRPDAPGMRAGGIEIARRPGSDDDRRRISGGDPAARSRDTDSDRLRRPMRGARSATGHGVTDAVHRRSVRWPRVRLPIHLARAPRAPRHEGRGAIGCRRVVTPTRSGACSIDRWTASTKRVDWVYGSRPARLARAAGREPQTSRARGPP